VKSKRAEPVVPRAPLFFIFRVFRLPPLKEPLRRSEFLTVSIIVVVVVNMSVRNQLSDYGLREFFRSLQDLLALSLEANLSFDSAEFLSRRLDGFERALSVLGCFAVESKRVPSFRKTTAF